MTKYLSLQLAFCQSLILGSCKRNESFTQTRFDTVGLHRNCAWSFILVRITHYLSLRAASSLTCFPATRRPNILFCHLFLRSSLCSCFLALYPFDFGARVVLPGKSICVDLLRTKSYIQEFQKWIRSLLNDTLPSKHRILIKCLRNKCSWFHWMKNFSILLWFLRNFYIFILSTDK